MDHEAQGSVRVQGIKGIQLGTYGVHTRNSARVRPILREERACFRLEGVVYGIRKYQCR